MTFILCDQIHVVKELGKEQRHRVVRYDGPIGRHPLVQWKAVVITFGRSLHQFGEALLTYLVGTEPPP